MGYPKTKDIVYVMRVLGYKNIRNTLIYTHLVNLERDDQFTCRVAHTVEEARNLMETGFEYVCVMGKTRLFRKRK
jgi:hypothetical protein